MKIKKKVEEPVMEEVKEPVVEEVKEEIIEEPIVEEVQEEKVEEVKEERVEEPEYYMLGITETLEDVAKKFNTTVERLKEINGEISATNQMRVR